MYQPPNPNQNFPRNPNGHSPHFPPPHLPQSPAFSKVFKAYQASLSLFNPPPFLSIVISKVTYRDSMGRITGTATTDNYGKTTYRDAMGRVVGTKK